MVLSRLRDYTLYVKMEKCEFAQKEIKFLGNLVSENQVRMDPKKVQAIDDWQAPHNVKDLRSFSRLANYYRKYVAGYSKRAAAMTDLLKNDVKCVWSTEDDLLYFKGGRIVVPNGDGLRKDLMKEVHDTTWAGHPSVEWMLALLFRIYFWPKMEDDTETYVKTCHICQVDKNEHKKKASLL
ncbi:hypothetical protein KY289_016635 [Solanum tuberosum]|nr:hypothetical protein KY289_016635 [Solanum tuberosum]